MISEAARRWNGGQPDPLATPPNPRAAGIAIPFQLAPELEGRGFRACAWAGKYPGHTCFGRRVVDHDHACANHNLKRACRSCVRGFLCDRANMAMAAWDEEYRQRGTTYLPPEIADYIEGRPLLELAALPCGAY